MATYTGNLFEELCSLENLLLAWERFKQGKSRRQDVMEFECDLERHLFELHDSLFNFSYCHASYEAFIVHDPKLRRIHKATVRDRVVHQAIVNVVGPTFEKIFIHDSYSCRQNKGTHAAVVRLRTFLRQASENNTRTVYALKCDIRRFFDSVDHELLFAFCKRRIFDERVLRLLAHIINSFSVSAGKGIPLGNLTSQLFANVYLHELDFIMKQELCFPFYLRYCDDFIIVDCSRKKMEALALQIAAIVSDRLLVTLHPNKVSLRSWKQGIDFLGFVVLPKAIVLRPKTRERMIRRVDVANVSSYLGLLSHADSFELRQIVLNFAYSRQFH